MTNLPLITVVGVVGAIIYFAYKRRARNKVVSHQKYKTVTKPLMGHLRIKKQTPSMDLVPRSAINRLTDVSRTPSSTKGIMESLSKKQELFRSPGLLDTRRMLQFATPTKESLYPMKHVEERNVSKYPNTPHPVPRQDYTRQKKIVQQDNAKSITPQQKYMQPNLQHNSAINKVEISSPDVMISELDAPRSILRKNLKRPLEEATTSERKKRVMFKESRMGQEEEEPVEIVRPKNETIGVKRDRLSDSQAIASEGSKFLRFDSKKRRRLDSSNSTGNNGITQVSIHCKIVDFYQKIWKEKRDKMAMDQMETPHQELAKLPSGELAKLVPKEQEKLPPVESDNTFLLKSQTPKKRTRMPVSTPKSNIRAEKRLLSHAEDIQARTQLANSILESALNAPHEEQPITKQVTFKEEMIESTTPGTAISNADMFPKFGGEETPTIPTPTPATTTEKPDEGKTEVAKNTIPDTAGFSIPNFGPPEKLEPPKPVAASFEVPDSSTSKEQNAISFASVSATAESATKEVTSTFETVKPSADKTASTTLPTITFAVPETKEPPAPISFGVPETKDESDKSVLKFGEVESDKPVLKFGEVESDKPVLKFGEVESKETASKFTFAVTESKDVSSTPAISFGGFTQVPSAQQPSLTPDTTSAPFTFEPQKTMEGNPPAPTTAFGTTATKFDKVPTFVFTPSTSQQPTITPISSGMVSSPVKTQQETSLPSKIPSFSSTLSQQPQQQPQVQPSTQSSDIFNVFSIPTPASGVDQLSKPIQPTNPFEFGPSTTAPKPAVDPFAQPVTGTVSPAPFASTITAPETKSAPITSGSLFNTGNVFQLTPQPQQAPSLAPPSTQTANAFAQNPFATPFGTSITPSMDTTTALSAPQTTVTSPAPFTSGFSASANPFDSSTAMGAPTVNAMTFPSQPVSTPVSQPIAPFSTGNVNPFGQINTSQANPFVGGNTFPAQESNPFSTHANTEMNTFPGNANMPSSKRRVLSRRKK